MSIHVLENRRWQPYFERVSKELGATEVEIEVTGLGIGDQVHSDWVTLNGLSYDPKADTMEVTAGPVDHRIYHPREVTVDDDMEGLHSISVINTEGHREIIKLRKPMMLPMSE